MASIGDMEPGFQGDSFQPQDEEAWQVGLRAQLPTSDVAFQQGAFQEEPLATGVGALASAEAFGTAKITVWVGPAGVTAPSNTAFQPGAFQEDVGGSQALGSTDVLFDAKPVGISSGAAFGTDSAVRILAPVGVASAAAAGAPGTVRVIAAVAIQSATAFGTPDTVRQIGPGGVSSATAFGTEKVVRLVGPAGIAAAEAWGHPTIGATTTSVTAAGAIPSTEVFGVPDVVRLEQTVGVAPAAQAGLPNTVRVVGPLGIASAEAFGTPTHNQVLAQGIPSGEAFGVSAVSGGVQVTPPQGHAGSSRLPRPLHRKPERQPTRQAVGIPGIASAEAFGRPAVEYGFAPIRVLTPDELASLLRIRESRQPLHTAQTGIPSQERLGTATVRRLVPPDVTRAFAEYLTDPEAVMLKHQRKQEDEELLLLELV